MTARKGMFWHRPGEALTWHAYDATGRSLCDAWVLVGCGRPADARKSTPKAQRCIACTAKILSKHKAEVPR